MCKVFAAKQMYMEFLYDLQYKSAISPSALNMNTQLEKNVYECVWLQMFPKHIMAAWKWKFHRLLHAYKETLTPVEWRQQSLAQSN